MDNSNNNILIIGGPRIDYQINSSTSAEFNLVEQNKIIGGINIGVNLAYNISNLKFGFDLKELIDFTKAVNHNNIIIKNNSLAIGLSLSYLLHNKSKKP